jgi:tRNA-2-methylthio-N6-dimethylallyladenosine synthase
MNRRHTGAEYIDLIGRIRDARPDLALSGDFIVGFPGESDADFEDTMEIVEAADYMSSFTFKYSPRPGTPAADRAGQVPDEVMSERLARLQARISERQAAFQRSLVGRRLEVLVERQGRHPGQMGGRSPYLIPVQIETCDAAPGDLVEVDVTDAGANSLFAAPAGGARDATRMLAEATA